MKKKLITVAGLVLAGGIAAGIWYAYHEYGPPCDDLAWEQEHGAGRRPEPHLFPSMDQRRDT